MFLKRVFYIFFLPLLGFWALLIAIYLGKDFEESFKLVPTFLYFVSSVLSKSVLAEMAFCLAWKNQGLCRLGLEFFSNGPENIYLHQTK